MLSPDDFPPGEMREMFRELLERPMHFVLDAEHNVIPLPRDRTGGRADTLMWASQQGDERPKECSVGDTTVRRWWGIVWVSTMFLGLDLGLSLHGPPRTFETMAFTVWPYARMRGHEWSSNHKGEGTQQRYVTWADATAGHWEVVERVRSHRGTFREAWWFWMHPLKVSFARFKRELGLPMLPEGEKRPEYWLFEDMSL